MTSKPFIKLVNIGKTYDDGYVACGNINITIDKGKFVTILGPSGCGKSTILKMIAGFEKPSAGKIIVNGIDIKDVPIHKRQTATFFQDYALFPNMTVFQNIAYGVKLLRKKLNNIPQRVLKTRDMIYKNALKQSFKKISDLKKNQLKIEKDLTKLSKFYLDDDYLWKIKDMRVAQFKQQIFMLEKKIIKSAKNNDYHGFRLSGKNKRRILWNKILSLFGIHRYVKFDKTNISNINELHILKLIKFYLYKKNNDAKVDHLKAKYWDLDEWISYWQNFPQLKVEEFDKVNTTRALTKEEINDEVYHALDLVKLTGYEHKYPSELSGGMQQRVALARAIVVKPDILLLDEPLSALDIKVKQKMQDELKKIHNELKINFIYVTHDQEEALSLSDLIIVMSKGKIEQIGTPKNIYEHPNNQWVANFIGQANFLNLKYINKSKVLIENEKFDVKKIKYQFNPNSINNIFKLMVRYEDIQACDAKQAMLIVKIISITYKGIFFDIKCMTKNKTFLHFHTIKQFHINEIIGIKWDFKCSIVLIDRNTNKNDQ